MVGIGGLIYLPRLHLDARAPFKQLLGLRKMAVWQTVFAVVFNCHLFVTTIRDEALLFVLLTFSDRYLQLEHQ